MVWRRHENICGGASTTESADSRAGRTWPRSVYNWWAEMELTAAAHVIGCFFLHYNARELFWWFCALVELLGPESRSLVRSHKSSLGLAHDRGRLSFAAQPQPNSSNPARSRLVCSPEPCASSGFAAGLRASDIIPFHCHPSHLFAF